VVSSRNSRTRAAVISAIFNLLRVQCSKFKVQSWRLSSSNL